jgi:hypothetical protein
MLLMWLLVGAELYFCVYEILCVSVCVRFGKQCINLLIYEVSEFLATDKDNTACDQCPGSLPASGWNLAVVDLNSKVSSLSMAHLIAVFLSSRSVAQTFTGMPVLSVCVVAISHWLMFS